MDDQAQGHMCEHLSGEGEIRRDALHCAVPRYSVYLLTVPF
jgi:hypothetical protein